MWRKSSQFLLLFFASLLWLDVFTYQGYLQTITHLPSKLILISVFVLGGLIAYLDRLRPAKGNHPILISGILLVSYCVIVAVEGSMGQGYVFAHIGLRPESLFITILSILWVIAANATHDLWRYLFLATICFYLVRLMPIVVTQSSVTLREVVRAPLATYDQKMGLLWGDFYAHMQQIRTSSPADSVVTIPADVRENPLEGNAALVRYFVYPRTVVVQEVQ